MADDIQGTLQVEVICADGCPDTQADNFFSLRGQAVYAQAHLLYANSSKTAPAVETETARIGVAPEGSATAPVWPTDYEADDSTRPHAGRTLNLPLL